MFEKMTVTIKSFRTNSGVGDLIPCRSAPVHC
jgi:hypothetical protein